MRSAGHRPRSTWYDEIADCGKHDRRNRYSYDAAVTEVDLFISTMPAGLGFGPHISLRSNDYYLLRRNTPAG